MKHTTERTPEHTWEEEMPQSCRAQPRGKAGAKNHYVNKTGLSSAGARAGDFRINAGQTPGPSVLEGEGNQQRMHKMTTLLHEQHQSRRQGPS